MPGVTTSIAPPELSPMVRPPSGPSPFERSLRSHLTANGPG